MASSRSPPGLLQAFSRRSTPGLQQAAKKNHSDGQVHPTASSGYFCRQIINRFKPCLSPEVPLSPFLGKKPTTLPAFSESG
jgi:hypothetical protein